MHMDLYICIHIYIYTCTHTHAYMHKYIYTYIYIHIHIHIYMDTYTYTYAYTYTSGPRTMLCCTWHLNAQCAVWSALSTQCTIILEHSNALSTQCTRSNGHPALSAIHLLGTKVPVRALCVVPCAREPRRPSWASLSLSLPLTRALPRLDLPVSVLSCDVRRYMRNPRARTGLS